MIQKLVALLVLVPTMAGLSGYDSHTKETGKRSVEIQAGADTIRHADGTILLSVDYKFPTVMIEGNQAATDKMNTYYEGVKEQFGQTVEKLLAYARADYNSRTKEQLAYWNGYAVSMQYEKARIDDKVMSLVDHYYEFTGGAHPNSTRWAETFATSTGEHLTLKDVVKDEVQARKDIEAYILKLTKNPQYKDYFFEGYEAHIPELLTDNTWYFSDEGFVVIANEYIIGPHAVGILEFTIPYSDAVFLKDAYRK